MRLTALLTVALILTACSSDRSPKDILEGSLDIQLTEKSTVLNHAKSTLLEELIASYRVGFEIELSKFDHQMLVKKVSEGASWKLQPFKNSSEQGRNYHWELIKPLKKEGVTIIAQLHSNSRVLSISIFEQ